MYNDRDSFIKDCSNGNIEGIKNFIIGNSKKTDYTVLRLDGFKVAAAKGNLEVLKLFVSDGETAYNSGALSACEANTMSVLDYLIEKGADMFGNCLELACGHNNYEMVKLLLANEKNDFDRGMIASCKNGNMEIFKLFFKINLNKKIKTYSSKTKGDAACIACQYGHIDIVKYLIDQDVKVFTKLFNISCLHGHFELVKYLYSSFSDKVNIDTGLENACHKEDNIDIIDFLVDKGIIDYDKSFEIAAKYNNPKNVKLLLDKGASNLNDALLSVCHSRLYLDFTEVINILINHGADNIALVLGVTYDNRNRTSFEAIVKNICKY